MKFRSTALVKGFRQSAPYVNAHRDKTVVIMLGGEAIANSNFANIVNDIALLNSLGLRIVIVYGTRPQMREQLKSTDHHAPFHKGIRITDEKTLELVKQVAGQLQLDITARLSMSLNNTPMAGTQINVISGNFIIAQPLGVDDGVDYCHSGRVRRIDTNGINRMLNQQSIVLLGPVASSVTGECFNLLSEDVATQLAIRLSADKLIGFCSEQGVLNEDGQILSELFPSEAEIILKRLEENIDLNDGNSTGTIRFLKGSITACKAGVPRSHLISYKEDGALIQELFSFDGIGTQVVMASSEQIRDAEIDDIGGIMDLIHPLEEEGILVRRSREQLEQEIAQFTIIEKDGLVIACAALYPFPEDGMAEMGCVAVHPDYRDGDRGVTLLTRLRTKAKQFKLSQLFVLTTRSLHWFREQGFVEVDVAHLPMTKQKLYNFQRKSKILVLKT